jgi:hypothetical protein
MTAAKFGRRVRRGVFVTTLFVGVVPAMVVFTACGDGRSGAGADTLTSPKDAAATSVAATVPRVPQLTTAELRAMIPTKTEFHRFVQPSNDIWLRHLKPLSDRRAPAGRIAGYEGDFWNACGGVCRPGLVGIAATVDAFKTAAQASQFLANQVKHNQDSVGKSSEFERVASANVFAPGDIGDESVGLQTKEVLLKEPGFFSAIVVGFRVSSIVGLASTNEIYRKESSSRAIALARLLEKRVSSVLGGTTSG